MTGRGGNNHGVHAGGARLATLLALALSLCACVLLAACSGSQGAPAAGSGSAGVASASASASGAGVSGTSASTDAPDASQGSPSATPGGDGETFGATFNQPDGILQVDLGPSTAGEPSIDVANASHGYVVAQAASGSRLKFQASCNGQTYNYDLPNDGTQTVFPLNMGDGSYKLRIMQNTSGSNYVELYSTQADVALESEFAPFLVANLFCSYNASSACVAKARELTGAAENQGEAVRAVCEYVASSVTYDNEKAQRLSTSTGYIPNPDETLEEKSGICFDYASLSAAMLRSLGIPTKIVTGYVGDQQIYHSWIMVYIDGGWQSVLFAVNPNEWSRCDVTFASTGASQLVGDASTYTDRYVY